MAHLIPPPPPHPTVTVLLQVSQLGNAQSTLRTKLWAKRCAIEVKGGAEEVVAGLLDRPTSRGDNGPWALSLGTTVTHSHSTNWFCGACSDCYTVEHWTHLVSLRRLLDRERPAADGTGETKFPSHDDKLLPCCMWRQKRPAEGRAFDPGVQVPRTAKGEDPHPERKVPLAGRIFLP